VAYDTEHERFGRRSISTTKNFQGKRISPTNNIIFFLIYAQSSQKEGKLQGI
jgi:hypothetical protein